MQREHILVARVVATMLAATVTTLWAADPDLWGHLRFGLDTIRDRAVHTTDPYSFTSDKAWINHEWLSEAALALAYGIGGVPGLLLLKVMVLASAVAVIARSLRSAGDPARWWLLAVAVAVVWPLVLTHRPQLWTVLALAALAASAHRPVRERLLWWPLLFAAWANLHGGWMVGLGVVGAHSAGSVLDRRDVRAAAWLALLCILCVAATALTPYGFDLWRFMCSTVGLDRNISDWRPLWRSPVVATVQWLLVVGAVVLASRRAQFTWAVALPVLMLAFASMKVVRLVGLFGIVAIPLVGRRWVPAGSSAPLVPAPIAVLSLVPAGFFANKQLRCVSWPDSWGPDLPAAAALAAAPGEGRIMVPFNWGEFAIWHFGPRLKVSMDGRRETVYSPRTLDEQAALDAGDPAILPFIGRERPEYVWLYVAQGRPIADALRQSGYREDLTTDRSIVLVRQDLPRLQPQPPMAKCFP